jgi:hypothetical protein
MKILSRLLGHFGYVRLKDYGYELTSGGKIVQVVQVEDDRFAPPPWQPVAFQSASSLLPPASIRPPEPRPLPPPPAGEAEPAPLFKVPGEAPSVESRAPGEPATAEDEEDSISIDEVPEEEEWEWKMALARARENAEKDKKDREKAKQERMAARRGDAASTFKTSSLPLAAPPARPTAKVVDTPKPMSKIARPEPRALRAPDKPAPKPAAPAGRSPIARVEPRAVTALPSVVKSNPRTMPPKAPPGSKSHPMAAVKAEPEVRPASRASLEKSVSRVFSPAAGAKPRPLPRLARGTESPGASARPTRPQLAQGSSRLPAVRDPSHDVTATDITAVDRAQASMKEDEDTRVNVAVLPPSADITLDIALDPEEKTTVDPKPNGVSVVSVSEGSPLPRLTARLRRTSVPN